MTLTLGMEKRMKGWPGEPQMEYDVLMADGNAAANAGRQITDVISSISATCLSIGIRRR